MNATTMTTAKKSHLIMAKSQEPNPPLLPERVLPFPAYLVLRRLFAAEGGCQTTLCVEIEMMSCSSATSPVCAEKPMYTVGGSVTLFNVKQVVHLSHSSCCTDSCPDRLSALTYTTLV